MHFSLFIPQALNSEFCEVESKVLVEYISEVIGSIYVIYNFLITSLNNSCIDSPVFALVSKYVSIPFCLQYLSALYRA